MDGFQLLLLAAVITGIIVVIIALFGLAKNSGRGARGENSAAQSVADSIKEADEAADELNKLAGSVMEELENKYKEVLFLYNLIDEKKQELYAQYKDTGEVKQTKTAAKQPKPKKTIYHPMKNEIMELHDKNTPVADIAKKLGIGQGEVNLVIELLERS